MRSPEEVAREIRRLTWDALGNDGLVEEDGPALADLIRSRDAEVAEAARAEALAGFAEHFAAAFEAADSRIAIMGHQVLDREYATRQAEEMSSPEDATPSFVARRLVGPWEPVEP